MRIIVCGGRDYQDRDAVFHYLDTLNKKMGIDALIHGSAAGADSLAREWAAKQGVLCWAYPAQWDRYGKPAGPIRNQKMIDVGKPDGIVAFPSTGPGTSNMVDLAEKAGIKVWFPCGRASVQRTPQ